MTIRSASLRFRAAHPGTMAAAAVEPQDAAASDDDRVKVMLRLDAKAKRLMASEASIQVARDAAPNDEQYRRLDLELDEARNERMQCDSRFTAIDAGRPFHDPGPDQENRLLGAIDAVDRALQNTAAVDALLGAVHNLVQAYPASSTA